MQIFQLNISLKISRQMFRHQSKARAQTVATGETNAWADIKPEVLVRLWSTHTHTHTHSYPFLTLSLSVLYSISSPSALLYVRRFIIAAL
jgi:hypothetical protein